VHQQVCARYGVRGGARGGGRDETLDIGEAVERDTVSMRPAGIAQLTAHDTYL